MEDESRISKIFKKIFVKEFKLKVLAFFIALFIFIVLNV